MSYRAFVEAAVDRMQAEGVDVVPSDTLARADAQGFATDTFEGDVYAELDARTSPADPRQSTLQF